MTAHLCGRVDPVPSPPPAAHRRRTVQVLTEAGDVLSELGRGDHPLQSSHDADGELDGAFDPLSIRQGRKEQIGPEHRLDQSRHVVVSGERLRQRRDQGLSGALRLTDQPAEQLANDRSRRGRFFEHDSDRVVGGETALSAQEAFDTVVVLAGQVSKPASQHKPAGHRPGRLADVLFGEVARSQRERFHQGADEALVGRRLPVHVGPQGDEGGRVARYRLEQHVERAQGVTSQDLHVLVHQPGILDGPGVRGKMAVPEQGHLLQQRMGRFDHPSQPPGPKSVDRAGRHVLMSVVGVVEGVSVRRRAQQPVHGRLGPLRERLLELLPIRSEGGTSVQMRGQGQIPGPPRIRLIGCPGPVGISQLTSRRHCDLPRSIDVTSH